jgi:cell wall-associated NlpC family hydrolase
MWSAAQNENRKTFDFYKYALEKEKNYKEEYSMIKALGTEPGQIVYNWKEDENPRIKSIDELSLRTGDVIFYNLSVASDKPGCDHVGVFLGYNADNKSIVIETRNNDTKLIIIEPGESNYSNCTEQRIQSDGVARIMGIVRYLPKK